MSRERWRMVAAFAAIYVIWGSTYLAIGYAVESLPPLLMIGFRSLSAGLVLLAWSRMRGAPWPVWEQWREALVVGALLFLGGQGVLAWAEQRVATGPAAVLNSTIPLFVVLLNWKGRRLAGSRSTGERPPVGILASIVIGLAGVGLMVSGKEARVAGVDPISGLLLLLSSLSWSVGSFRAVSAPDRWPVRRSGMQLVGGGLVVLAGSVLVGEVNGWDPAAVTAKSLWSLAWLVVFGSLIGYSAYTWLLVRTTPARVSSHAWVNPVVALGLGWLVGGESITPLMLTGALLIVGSVAASVLGGGRRESASQMPARSVLESARRMTRRPGPGLPRTAEPMVRVGLRGGRESRRGARPPDERWSDHEPARTPAAGLSEVRLP